MVDIEHITKEAFIQAYLVDRLPIMQIATNFGICVTQVASLGQKFSIPPRFIYGATNKLVIASVATIEKKKRKSPITPQIRDDVAIKAAKIWDKWDDNQPRESKRVNQKRPNQTAAILSVMKERATK